MSDESHRRLYRSRSHRMLCGVAGGLGEYLDIDPTLIRLALVALVLASFGWLVLFYFIACIVIPEEPLEARTVTPPPPGPEFEKKMEDFGHRMEDFGERMGQVAERIGEKVGAAAARAGESATAAAARAEDSARRVRDRGVERSRTWFGLILVFAGLLLLANQFEFLHWTAEFVVPAVLILLGVLILANSVHIPPVKPSNRP